jgi:hypothetical protein
VIWQEKRGAASRATQPTARGRHRSQSQQQQQQQLIQIVVNHLSYNKLEKYCYVYVCLYASDYYCCYYCRRGVISINLNDFSALED